MFYAGWVFHPAFRAPGPGAPPPDASTGLWFHPVTRATCTHAQARRPPAADPNPPAAAAP
eukprot:10095574-Alexandrium_andersonii.AAC.1